MKFSRLTTLMSGRHFAVALCLATLLIYGLAGGARYLRYGKLSAFVGFGCVEAASICFARDNATVLPPGALIFRTGGYDGQFYYYLAAELRDPAYAARLDSDAFRRARIGYPLLAFPAAFAGPGALVLAMVAIPAGVHFAVLLFLLRRTRPIWNESSARAGPGFAGGRLALIAFALNPVSLFCYLYALADGLALDLMVLGLLLLAPDRTRSGTLAVIAGGTIFALAALTKEHALAGVAGACFALIGIAIREHREGFALRSAASVHRALRPGIAGGIAAAILAGWWRWVGFHPGQAAERGGLPLSGLIDYLAGDPDAFFSGRSYLILLLLAWIAVGAALAAAIFKIFRRGSERDRGRATAAQSEAAFWWALVATGILAANLVLVSFATADEYWGNYANILRLFTPGFGALVCLALVVAAEPESDEAFPAPAALRWALGLAVVASLASVFAILESEIAGALLPVFEFGVGAWPSF